MLTANLPVLVIGSTGFIGTAVVKQLLQEDFKINCFVRETSDLTELRQLSDTLTFYTGDILSKESLSQAMKNSKLVINCSGVNSFWERKKKTYYNGNILGTQKIMETALENNIEKVVHVSTVMAYGFPDESPFSENSGVGAHMSEYARSKYEGDTLAENLNKNQKLPLVIVYLAAVLGEGDKKDVMKIRRFIDEKIPLLLENENKFTYVYIKDAAKAIVSALKKSENIGEKYLVGKERLTTNEYFQKISTISGAKMPNRTIGKSLSFLLARMLTAFAKITGKPPLMPIDLIKTQFKDSLLFDTSKAEKELNITYTPIDTALEKEIEYIYSLKSSNS